MTRILYVLLIQVMAGLSSVSNLKEEMLLVVEEAGRVCCWRVMLLLLVVARNMCVRGAWSCLCLRVFIYYGTAKRTLGLNNL